MITALAVTLVLVGGTIVDVSKSGQSAGDIRDSVIVMRDGKIVAAGPRNKTKIPAGANVIRIDGTYVLPGLNDVFAGMNNQTQANAYLYMGVTSIVGSDVNSTANPARAAASATCGAKSPPGTDAVVMS